VTTVAIIVAIAQSLNGATRVSQRGHPLIGLPPAFPRGTGSTPEPAIAALASALLPCQFACPESRRHREAVEGSWTRVRPGPAMP
jgi:hypothetical protein